MASAADFELTDFLPYLLTQAADTLGLAFQRHYKARYGLLRTEWRVLFHLGCYGAMTATEVGRRARLHKTKVSRAVAALGAKRYLRREDVETDRRQQLLSLTPAGERVFRDLNAAARRFDDEIALSLSTAELAVLRKCLRRLAELPE